MSTEPAHTASNRPWDTWLAEHAEVFFLYARQQSRCESDAKDILQDVLLELWNKAHDQLPDRALVFATIRRRAMDLGRSIDRRSKRESSVADAAPTWFIPDVSANDSWQCLSHAVQNLSPDLREVLILRIWGDLTFPAIAEMLAVPIPTATSRYRYALEKLRERLPDLQP